jgi:Flp pilus assembly protein TadB
MRLYWSSLDHSGLRLAPALLGGLLILIGVLLYVWPQLLSFVVATVFVAAGCSLLFSAWRLRRDVTYQRIEPTWRAEDVTPPE